MTKEIKKNNFMQYKNVVIYAPKDSVGENYAKTTFLKFNSNDYEASYR